VFPKVAKIEIGFYSDWRSFSLQLLSIFINFAQIVEMKLKIYYFDRYHKDTLLSIGIFLEQAHNLSSLIIGNNFVEDKSSQIIENIFPIIPRRLKHLQLPIKNLNHIKMILEQCDNLSTIKFNIKSKFSSEIIQWFNNNTINSSYWQDCKTITVWIGKKNIQATDVRIDNKRMTII
jgi:hypothetical protein